MAPDVTPAPSPAVSQTTTTTARRPISEAAERGLTEAVRRLDGLSSTGRGYLEIDATIDTAGRAGARAHFGQRLGTKVGIGVWGQYVRGAGGEIGARGRLQW